MKMQEKKIQYMSDKYIRIGYKRKYKKCMCVCVDERLESLENSVLDGRKLMIIRSIERLY